MGRPAAASLLLAAAALLAPAWAVALPDCPSPPQAQAIASDQGRLESILSDSRGRLFYTDLTANRLLRLDGPGQQPKVLAQDMMRPGGLVFEPSGALVAGFNGGALSGVPGNGMAGLFRVDPETGVKEAFARGLDQANGVVRGGDGSFYASNNIAGEVTRVLPDGRVEKRWAAVESANGLALDRREQRLYAAQTFTPAQIARVDLARPDRVDTWFAAPPEDTAAGLDGITRDDHDTLFVAANGAGEVWRVEGPSRACVLARGLFLPSALAFGGGGPGFAAENLYVVTFGGRVIELAGVGETPAGQRGRGGRAPGAPAAATLPGLRVSVSPRRARAGRRVTLRFRVTSAGRPVPGARIRAGRRSASTDARGTARLVQRFRRAGRVRIRISRAGYRPAVVTLRVLRRR
jgi:sugar lactone lactonase YvrE